MDSKHRLRRVRRLDEMIEAKIDQIKTLREMATKVNSHMTPDRVQTCGTSDKVGSSVAKMVDLQEEINRSIDELVDIKNEVMQMIDAVENEDHKIILTLRYLNNESWEKIAVTLGYTYRHVTRLHGEALKEMENMS